MSYTLICKCPKCGYLQGSTGARLKLFWHCDSCKHFWENEVSTPKEG